MQFEHITSAAGLADFCGRLAHAKTIAFDTEFVSEDSYRPDLCLIQVAAAGELAIIDPKAAGDVEPFWELLVEPSRQVIVHSGREEMKFCHLSTGGHPPDLFDVQLAAALAGTDYPASYGTLVSRHLGKSIAKGETRTDWRRRPLSDRQLEYALVDVLHLEPLRDVLYRKLVSLGRLEWLREETAAWLHNIESAEAGERWRRLPGSGNLTPRQMAIAREVWQWREQEAEKNDSPPRRILRDDLLVELARRETADERRIRALRGMEYRNVKRHVPKLAHCIEKALAIPLDRLPRRERRPSTPQLGLLGRFLATALAAVCAEAEIAASLVGTEQDVRALVAHQKMLPGARRPPALAEGWRAEVVGRKLEELLDGRLSLFVADALADQPLGFSPHGDGSP